MRQATLSPVLAKQEKENLSTVRDLPNLRPLVWHELQCELLFRNSNQESYKTSFTWPLLTWYNGL